MLQLSHAVVTSVSASVMFAMSGLQAFAEPRHGRRKCQLQQQFALECEVLQHLSHGRSPPQVWRSSTAPSCGVSDCDDNDAAKMYKQHLLCRHAK